VGESDGQQAASGASADSSAEPSPELLSDEQRRRVLSSSRLRIALTQFVAALLLALGILTTMLISRIFGQLNPTIRQDLAWKAERGALEIVESADVGILLGDPVLVGKSFDRYRVDSDVVAIVATDVAGNIVAKQGKSPVPIQRILAGPPNTPQALDGFLCAWAEAVVEGKPVGRVAMVVSTERLAAGERLKRRIILTLGLGCVAGVLLSLFFVRFYIGPLIRLTERAFDRLREAALAMVAKQRLESELEIGAKIQTCILPKGVDVPGLKIAAHMQPATEVGGDYYDVIPATDGCWVGIGDVAGHGFTSGLVMLMAQSAISALAEKGATHSPREVLCDANRLLHNNIVHRLGKDEFVTMSLLRCFRDGRVVYAGAHEVMLVYRAATRRCEEIPTPGTWLGVAADISRPTVDRTLKLDDGDVLVLYTDGVTEAMDAKKEQFGLERLAQAIERNGEGDTQEILDAIFGDVRTWMDVQQDDITALVMRYRAEA
jgi:hypothetical protein